MKKNKEDENGENKEEKGRDHIKTWGKKKKE